MLNLFFWQKDLNCISLEICNNQVVCMIECCFWLLFSEDCEIHWRNSFQKKPADATCFTIPKRKIKVDNIIWKSIEKKRLFQQSNSKTYVSSLAFLKASGWISFMFVLSHISLAIEACLIWSSWGNVNDPAWSLRS